MEKHHVIPISIWWNHTDSNKIDISNSSHKELHNRQNIPYNFIRKYRERTNHILVPNDYTLDMKWELYQRYFENADIHKEKQLISLNWQGLEYARRTGIQLGIAYTIAEAVNNYIEQQKRYIKILINN